MVETVKNNSAFYQLLTETDQHGSAAIVGMKEVERIGIFDEYDAAFWLIVLRYLLPFRFAFYIAGD